MLCDRVETLGMEQLVALRTRINRMLRTMRRRDAQKSKNDQDTKKKDEEEDEEEKEDQEDEDQEQEQDEQKEQKKKVKTPRKKRRAIVLEDEEEKEDTNDDARIEFKKLGDGHQRDARDAKDYRDEWRPMNPVTAMLLEEALSDKKGPKKEQEKKKALKAPKGTKPTIVKGEKEKEKKKKLHTEAEICYTCKRVVLARERISCQGPQSHRNCPFCTKGLLTSDSVGLVMCNQCVYPLSVAEMETNPIIKPTWAKCKKEQEQEEEKSHQASSSIPSLSSSKAECGFCLTTCFASEMFPCSKAKEAHLHCMNCVTSLLDAISANPEGSLSCLSLEGCSEHLVEAKLQLHPVFGPRLDSILKQKLIRMDKVDCCCCLKTCLSSDMFPCGKEHKAHLHCMQCVTSLFDRMSANPDLSLSCLSLDDCSEHLVEEKLKFDPVFTQRLTHIAKQKAIQDMKKAGLVLKYCPNPECNAEVVLEIEKDEKHAYYICPHCQTQCCSLCFQVVHQGSCSKFDGLDLVQMRISQCPLCHQGALHAGDDSCNNMSCRDKGCKGQWCAVCRTDITKVGYDHFCRRYIDEANGTRKECVPDCSHCSMWSRPTPPPVKPV